MISQTRGIVAVCMVCAGLTACTSKVGAEDPPASPEAATVESLPISPAGQEFLRTTFENGLLEIAAAKLAIEKSSNAQVLQFAQLMYQSYSRTNDSLRQIAFENGFELPSEPNIKGRDLLERLASLAGADFDGVYSHEMRKAHRTATQRFDAAAQSAPDSIVQTFARSQLPAARDRFHIAQTLPGHRSG